MDDIRWKQRFENFEKAYKTFLEALNAYRTDENSIVFKMAIIQAFEFTYELSWNLMKDYLVEQGVSILEKTPRGTVKEAYAAGIIEDGQIWMDLIDTRNILSHAYSEEKANNAVIKITTIYVEEFSKLLIFLKERL